VEFLPDGISGAIQSTDKFTQERVRKVIPSSMGMDFPPVSGRIKFPFRIAGKL
jgi:hypothetical protein